MKLKFIFLLLFTSLLTAVSGQISYGGKPLSFLNKTTNKSLPVFYTPHFDYQKLIEEDELNKGEAKPFRFGKMHLVNINPENSGVWTVLNSGEKIWRLQIHSDKAYAIGLYFKGYQLNKGVRFFVYSPDKSSVKGAFTAQNNKANKILSVLPLSGEDIILELNVPKDVDYGEFTLSGITHDYKNAFGKKLKSTQASGSCNVNVNCPEGDQWQNEKRSVVKYTYVDDGGGSYMCSGALINNVRKDATPYLLTANHCISSSTEAASAVFIFNYESELCNGTTGPTNQTVSAADLIATPSSWSLDFSLLKLTTDPPAEYNIYFAGWNRSTSPAANTTTIHHPSGDIKKISFDYDPPVTGNYGGGTVTNSHWKILEWDLGTTEGGSSGSPLFDENHRIVGDLTGGDASCSYNYNDYYAKFDMSWDYFADPNQQLKAWLDPDNTGVMTLDGYDPNVPVDSLDLNLANIKFPSGTFCLDKEIIPEVEIKNAGLKDITSFKVFYSLNNNSLLSYDWSGNLTAGAIVSIQLPAMQAYSGTGVFTAYTSNPNNAIDENHVNDTLTSKFQADTIITNLKVQGDEYICSDELRGVYYVNETGDYNWSVSSGDIYSGNKTAKIAVYWNKWGDRKVYLSLKNTCGDYPATPMEVKPVMQEITLNINTEDYPVSWTLTSKENNYTETGEIPENSGNVSIHLCVPAGDYILEISNIPDCQTCSFTVNDSNNNVLVSGNFAGINSTVSFNVNEQKEAIYNVYPNPAKDLITIEASFIEGYHNASFAVYTLNGSVKIPENPLKEPVKVDISELKNGYYLIKIKSDYGETTKSFVKQ